MGFLPEAMRNYLLRLGWSHGDDEIISTEQAIEWFDLDVVGRGAARFDLARLTSLNAHYLRQTDDAELAALIAPRLEAEGMRIDQVLRVRLEAAMAGLKPRATTLVDLAERARFYVAPRPIALDVNAAKLLDQPARERLAALAAAMRDLASWDEAALEATVRAQAEAAGVKLGQLAQPLRAALTGSTASPGIFEVMVVLGREEVLARLRDVVEGLHAAAQHSD
jgi:glutamyl-tRNA synthetase